MTQNTQITQVTIFVGEVAADVYRVGEGDVESIEVTEVGITIWRKPTTTDHGERVVKDKQVSFVYQGFSRAIFERTTTFNYR